MITNQTLSQTQASLQFVQAFPNIKVDAAILGGKPCIKGTRLSVAFILELLASGATQSDILAKYPHIPDSGISEALQYAALFLTNEIIITTEVSHEPA